MKNILRNCPMKLSDTQSRISKNHQHKPRIVMSYPRAYNESQVRSQVCGYSSGEMSITGLKLDVKGA